MPRPCSSLLRRSIPVLVCAVGLTAGSVFTAGDARDDNGSMQILFKTEETAGKDKLLCQRVAYSKAFEQWTAAYCKGDENAAQKYWKQVLDQLGDCDDIGPLLDAAGARTAMRDVDVPEPANAILPRFLTELTKQTIAAVGPKHRFVGPTYRLSARYLEGQHKIKEALVYRQKQLNILKGSTPQNFTETSNCLTMIGNDARLVGDGALAESSFKAALDMGMAHRMPFESTNALTAYTNYLKCVGRAIDATAVCRKYAHCCH